jgi:hypothetical protein
MTAMTTREAWMLVLRRAWWAPVGAIALHKLAPAFGLHEELDNVVHFLGGAAAAYFSFRWCEVFGPRLGATRTWTHHLASFCLACTAGVFVEIGEFAADQLFGSHTQKSLRETMLDLVSDVAGALAVLLVLAIVRRRRDKLA